MTDRTSSILSFGEGSGCACKADWQVMEELRRSAIFSALADRQLGLDDAATVDMFPGSPFAATVDFIGPVAHSAADYGYIAAAHALSDLFAVGATPSYALAVTAWPRDDLVRDALPAALEGMQAALSDAGVRLIGGHTANSAQPLLGLCAFGVQKALVRKRPVSDGDVLYLSKPLGFGVAIGALREGSCSAALETLALEGMRSLNTVGLDLADDPSAKLVSDITGFGLVGQLLRLTERMALSAVICGADLPALPEVREMIAKGAGAMAAERNFGLMRGHVFGTDRVNSVLACDPQTNGPLLVVGDDSLSSRSLIRIGVLRKHQTPSVIIE